MQEDVKKIMVEKKQKSLIDYGEKISYIFKEDPKLFYGSI